ncbi:MAG: SDR family NAD(P)-dependent oxidoreductase [Candidatus Latescibacterota bacterium]|nr:SDR family NAD(P)-dependent oxidoreductase [Candidatus Latescibacterota bacterium]
MGKLDGKVALVTGGNRGIGKAIARALAAEGAALTLAARGADALAQTAQEIAAEFGVEVLGVPTDVADEAQVDALFASAQERHGRLDVLINNAGAFDGGPIEDITMEAWHNVVGACLTGPFLCTRAAFRTMKEQGGGRIINIGSISAQMPRMYSVPYTATKHGVWGLTKAAALEGRDHGIVVSALHPGNVRVERRMNEGSNTAGSGMVSDGGEPMMSMEEIADACLHMAALPPHVNFLEAIVLPTEQHYVGRG